MRIAVCPGSFDPITNGHVDIITRASKLFDKVIVLIVINPQKKPVFTVEKRKEFINKSVAHLSNVEVDSYKGLLATYAKEKDIIAIVKGLRAVSDFEYEFQMALTNKKLIPEVETVFLNTNPQHLYTSSSLVKEIAQFGGDIKDFVPSAVHDEIQRELFVYKEE